MILIELFFITLEFILIYIIKLNSADFEFIYKESCFEEYFYQYNEKYLQIKSNHALFSIIPGISVDGVLDFELTDPVSLYILRYFYRYYS